jgi:hypothetical protein
VKEEEEEQQQQHLSVAQCYITRLLMTMSMPQSVYVDIIPRRTVGPRYSHATSSAVWRREKCLNRTTLAISIRHHQPGRERERERESQLEYIPGEKGQNADGGLNV